MSSKYYYKNKFGFKNSNELEEYKKEHEGIPANIRSKIQFLSFKRKMINNQIGELERTIFSKVGGIEVKKLIDIKNRRLNTIDKQLKEIEEKYNIKYSMYQIGICGLTKYQLKKNRLDINEEQHYSLIALERKYNVKDKYSNI